MKVIKIQITIIIFCCQIQVTSNDKLNWLFLSTSSITSFFAVMTREIIKKTEISVEFLLYS